MNDRPTDDPWNVVVVMIAGIVLAAFWFAAGIAVGVWLAG